jgi:hypothetical protein
VNETIDIVGLVEQVKDLVNRTRKRSFIEKVLDRTYLVREDEDGDAEYQEITPRFEDTAPHGVTPSLLRLADLALWATEENTADGQVTLSRRGRTVAITPRKVESHLKRECAEHDFYDEFDGPRDWVSPDEFRDWIDKIRPGMAPADATTFDLALSSITATLSETVEIKMDGALIRSSFKRDGNVGEAKMPRYIVATVPWGDPEHVTQVRWVLTAKQHRDHGLIFRVRHDKNDGSLDAWLAWAETLLGEKMPDGWVVFTAA